MSDISKQRLIDGDKLLECLNTDALELYEKGAIVPSGILVILRDKIESGVFDISSNQGEAARLRDRVKLLENYLEDLREVTPYGMVKEQITNVLNESRGFSSHTEDKGIQKARSIDEWHEDYGDVLWWTFPIEEPPYVGSPLANDWPGYHTHWTDITIPEER